MMLVLEQTKRTDERLLLRMENHYSKPKGFVGRNICYAILYGDVYYGHIIAGSATRFLPGRNEFLGTNLLQLNNIINNIFFNISPLEDNKYPVRNFSSFVLKQFLTQSAIDWKQKYGDEVIGFESLVEKPRVGEVYLRSGFTLVGETKGFTCKRVGGNGSDSYSGKRVWNTDSEQLRPKLVFAKKWS